jgi:lipopolysaccharide heptosyltransferase I
MPRPPLSEIAPRRIALLKPSALGDVIHALPVLTALRRRFPEAHLTWIVNRAYEPLLHGHPHLNATLAFDRSALKRGWWSGLTAFGRFLGEVRRQRFDLIVDLQGLLRSGLMTAASGAARRVGLSSAREGSRWFYTDVVPVSEPARMHAVDRYWLVAEALGAGGSAKEFVVPVPDEVRTWADEVLRSQARPWLMLGAGSRWLTKRWLPEHFAELARRAQSEFGGTVIFIGGADESDLARQVQTGLTGPSCDLTGRTSLPQLAAILARADALLANDTGPLHLAVALGRPIVAPYTCTRTELTGPYLSQGRTGGAIATSVWCAGSLQKRCSRMECMAELTPDRLWPLLQEVLQSWRRYPLSA